MTVRGLRLTFAYAVIKTVYKSFISCFIKPEAGYQIDTSRLIRGFISLESFSGVICYLPSSCKISNQGLRDSRLLILFCAGCFEYAGFLLWSIPMDITWT